MLTTADVIGRLDGLDLLQVNSSLMAVSDLSCGLRVLDKLGASCGDYSFELFHVLLSMIALAPEVADEVRREDS